MRTITLFFVMAVIALLLQTSCSIEKRHYRPGFYVENSCQKSSRLSVEKKDLKLTDIAELKQEKNMQAEEPVFATDFHQQAVETALQNEPVLMAETKFVATQQISRAVEKNMVKSAVVQLVKENRKALALPSKKFSGGKNQIVALLLCFFLGVFGVHSFYLGNKRKGIIQLVMLLVGWLTSIILIGWVIITALIIWVFIDFIRIIIGDLGPGW